MTRSGVILIAASATLVCGLARAADLEVVKAEPPTIYTPNNYLWGGVYVGGFIGGAWDTADWGAGTVAVALPSGSAVAATSLFIPHTNISAGGFIGGGRVGANYQVGPYVFGFEGDFAGMALKGHATVVFSGTATATGTSPPATTVNYTTTSAYQTTANWVTTFTGKVGYTFERVLAYGKVGAAIEQDGNSEISTTVFTTTTPTSGPTTSVASRAGTATRYGWTAGLGAEYALNNNWWAFVEYDHLGFLSQLINFVSPANGTTTTRKVQLNVDRIVAGADYHF
ncbi:MAG TPA: outer membrane beta-barrel protein [Xanthobacteraceae bacterium]|jgi:outer membrane immunogenic protein